MGTILSRIALTASLAAALSLPAPAANSNWQIDPAHSSAQFSVRHMAKSTVEVTIDANSVDTRVPDRDNDLRSEKFFDVARYPSITFKSRKVEQLAPGKLKVTGDLTIRGTTKEVVLDVEGPTAPMKDPWGNTRTAANATTKINRQDFGVKWNATLDNGGVVVGDDVSIIIDVELVKKDK